MTHVLDTSGVLAHYFREPGGLRIQEIFDDPTASVGISVLPLVEIAIAVAHQTGDVALGNAVSGAYAMAVAEIVPVTEEVASQALLLRRSASARIAFADLFIAATAASLGAILVHRDPHFAALPAAALAQETLPDKA